MATPKSTRKGGKSAAKAGAKGGKSQSSRLGLIFEKPGSCGPRSSL